MAQKYNVLYIGAKWHAANPEYGICSVKYDAIGTLEATGFAKCDWFGFDEFWVTHNKQPDEALIELCKQNKFDFIILDWFNGVPKLNPIFETLDILTNEMNIPMIGIWWDMIYFPSIMQAEALLPYVKFHIIQDTSVVFYTVKDPSRYLFLWLVRDPTLYYDEGEENRDIPISFIGRLKKPDLDRSKFLKVFEGYGINVFHAGGQMEGKKLSMEEYASYIRRSKITLSFPQSVRHLPQASGRAIEAMLSGSMVLEEMNLENAKLFRGMKDYVAFHTDTDMVLKAMYFMANDEERIKIAQSGRKRAMEFYSNERFWGIVLNRLKRENAL